DARRRRPTPARSSRAGPRPSTPFPCSATTPKGEPPPPASVEASPSASSLPELLGQIDAIAEGATDTDTIASGFPSLDRSIGGGFRRGDLAVLGGDVGSGKSAFALAIALRV